MLNQAFISNSLASKFASRLPFGYLREMGNVDTKIWRRKRKMGRRERSARMAMDRLVAGRERLSRLTALNMAERLVVYALLAGSLFS